MNLNHWLLQATSALHAAGIATARLDALVLLEDELNTNRTHLLAHPELELTPKNIKVLDAQIDRRVTHEPLAFVRGKTEFYGREFIISPAVLEPRPESETMIDLLLTRHAELVSASPTRNITYGILKQVQDDGTLRIADVGTGSGALGITAQLELPQATVDLLEIDSAAIKIAQKNVIKFATQQTILHSNLLSATSTTYDILLCNLPYVPDDHTINQAAMHEPKIAIFGGLDGLDLYRRLFQQIRSLKNKPLLILCESLPPQHTKLAEIAEQAGYKQATEDDFIQAFQLN